MPARHGFIPLPTDDPGLGRVQLALKAALDLLASQVTGAPAWATMTFPTLVALRAQVGDANAINGPRGAILCGKVQTKDGGEGVYVWDPASTADDNGTTVVKPLNVPAGRWRKV